jgi:transcriptional regulator with XRE-family HTH domain
MNADYAHLLGRPLVLDWSVFGDALRAVMRMRRMTLEAVGRETRLSRATISRASTGHAVSLEALMKLCIWADLNPFELLRPADRRPEEYIDDRAQRGCFT